MTSRPSLDRRYPDLLQTADAELTRLVGGLDRLLGSAEPPASLYAALDRLAAEATPVRREGISSAPEPLSDPLDQGHHPLVRSLHRRRLRQGLEILAAMLVVGLVAGLLVVLLRPAEGPPHQPAAGAGRSTPVATPQPGWSSFTLPDPGLAFDHPEDWTLRQVEFRVVATAPDQSASVELSLFHTEPPLSDQSPLALARRGDSGIAVTPLPSRDLGGVPNAVVAVDTTQSAATEPQVGLQLVAKRSDVVVNLVCSARSRPEFERWQSVCEEIITSFRFTGSPPTSQQPSVTPVGIASGPHGSFAWTVTDGTYVVWSGTMPGESEPGIYAARLSDRQPFAVRTGLVAAPPLALDHGTLLWVEGSDACPHCADRLRARELDSGREYPVAEGGVNAPAIVGHWAVWLAPGEGPGSGVLLARDLSTMAPPTVLATSSGCGLQAPAIDGDRVVWTEPVLEGPRTCGESRLLTRRISDPTVTTVAEGVRDYDVGGDVVVYVDANYNLVAADLVAGERTILHQPTVDRGLYLDAPSDPTTNGRYVFWTQTVVENPRAATGRSDLWGYDLTSGRRFPVSWEGFNLAPETNGGGLVWRQWQGPDGRETIYSGMLPR